MALEFGVVIVVGFVKEIIIDARLGAVGFGLGCALEKPTDAYRKKRQQDEKSHKNN